MRVNHWLAGVALGAVVLSTPAFAQEAATPQAAEDNSGLADIVVTARKRAESLITVPVAVTALGQSELGRYNASSLQQISQLVPQLTITTVPSGSGASLSIRGIGSVGEDPGVDQSVGVYIDNVGIARGRIIGVAMFDIQQVEVLKGPQALFFGKNSPAGVVSLTSAGPGNHLEAGATAGYEFQDKEKYLEAYVSGPLTDTLGARLAVRGEGMNGWVRNVAQPIADPLTGLTTPGAGHSNSPRTKKFAARLTLQYKPSADLSVTGKFFAAYSRVDDPTGSTEHQCAPGVVFSVAGVPDAAEDCRLNRVHTNTGINPALAANWPRANNGKLYGKTNVQSGSVSVNYGSGPLALTSVTAYSRLEYHDLFNASESSYEALIPQSNELTKTFSQELRLTSDYDGPLNFTLGGFYEHVNRKSPNSVALLFVGADTRTGVDRNWNFTREAFNKSNTVSAFGQLRWDIVDDVEFAAGVRYTRDRKKVRIGNSFVNPAAEAVFATPGSPTTFFLPEGTYFSGTFSNSNWSPEATLTWHPDPNQTLYAAFKTGYKSGGFSNTLLLGGAFTLNDLTYAPEKTKGGEIGYKARLFDNRVRFETAIYRYKFSGLQLSAFDARTFSYFIRNAAAARTTGAEVSTRFKATDNLTLRGDVAYNKAKFLDFPGAQCFQGQTVAQGCNIGNGTQNLGGKPLPRAPKWTFNPGASLDLPVGDDLKIGLDADAQYKSSYYTDPSLAPLIKQNGFWLINAAVRLTSQDSGWQLSLIGRNLTDKIYVNYAVDSGLAPIGVWSSVVERGRQIALQAKIDF